MRRISAALNNHRTSGLSRTQRKHVLRGEKAVESGRETGVDGHLHQNLDDFLAGQSDVQAGLDMHLELRGAFPIAANAAMVAISRERRSRPGRE